LPQYGKIHCPKIVPSSKKSKIIELVESILTLWTIPSKLKINCNN
jgi:hypothetical protein